MKQAPTKKAIAAGVYHGGEAIDRVFEPLGPALSAAVTEHAEDGKITPLAMAKILTAWDTEIAPKAFGTGPTSDSPVRAIVVAQQAAAVRVLLDELGAAIDARKLPPPAAAALKRDAGVTGPPD